ncbi:ETX/MTX2 family pore-forming toxin [Spiroplasma endosymbiont of Stenodema calcarata]|uniref:ETX/MTX2 family pore-forming toxin n=1 Tax=Spiroplasma endosymbiont of Stenodema calcarata TaxID=3139328 RepID=UPI003CCB2874
MNKILKLLTAVFSINFFVMPLAYQHNLLNNNITDSQTPKIINLDDYITYALYSDFKAHHPSVLIRNLNVISKNLTYSNENVSVKDSTSLNDIEPGIYFGKATFTNKTASVQTFQTPEFIQKVTTTYTYQTITGISAGIELKFKYLDFNYKVNYSKTDINTTTNTVTLTAPNQAIKVKPHTITTASVYLGTSKGNAYLNLNADISGTVKCEINKINGIGITYEANIVDAFKSLQKISPLPDAFSIKDNNSLHFNGLGIIDGFVTKTNYFVTLKYTPIE